MDAEAIGVIKTRRSVREFGSDPVDEAVIRDVVDCGRLAPSAHNKQLWEFVVVRDAAMRGQLKEVMDHGKFLDQSPVCIAVFCRAESYYVEDGSAAIENILLAARAHGLGSCWIAGDKKPYAATIGEMLGAPEGVKLVGVVALGYATGEPKMPRKRTLDEVLHWERF